MSDLRDLFLQLDALCANLPLSRRGVAKALGCSSSTLTRWSQGHAPSGRVMLAAQDFVAANALALRPIETVTVDRRDALRRHVAGELSEGQLVRMLEVDRLVVRELVDGYLAEERLAAVNAKLDEIGFDTDDKFDTEADAVHGLGVHCLKLAHLLKQRDAFIKEQSGAIRTLKSRLAQASVLSPAQLEARWAARMELLHLSDVDAWYSNADPLHDSPVEICHTLERALASRRRELETVAYGAPLAPAPEPSPAA